MPTSSPKDLILVLPVFEDSESAGLLLGKLAQACPVLPYVVIVEDGSIRDPLPMSALAAAGLQGEILYLRRNIGHQRAIAVGLTHVARHHDAKGVVVMDSDGEDLPQSIAPLLAQLQRYDIDAVVAERRHRSESIKFRFFYAVYRRLFKLMTGRWIRFGNFTALSMRAVKRLVIMPELWVHMAAALIVSRLRVARVATDRGRRYAGRSQMNFVSLALHGLRSMMVFAEDVVVRVCLFCAVLVAAALGLLAVATTLKLIGLASPGWFTAAAGLLVLIVLQAGVLTFVTLMMSGLTRGAVPVTNPALDDLIDRIEATMPADAITFARAS